MVKAGDEGKPKILQHTGPLTVKAVDVVMENLFYGSEKRFTGSGYVWQTLREQRALLPQVRGQGRSAGFFNPGPVKKFQSRFDRSGSQFQLRS